MQRRAFLASVTTAVAGLGGCLAARRYAEDRVGDEDGPATPSDGRVTTAIPADQLIEIRNDAFRPQVAEVHAGSLVRWANHDERDHEITSAQFHDSAAFWEFSSGVVGPGETVTHTFEEAGVYGFYSSTRGRETTCGAVLVGDVELPGSLPCE